MAGDKKERVGVRFELEDDAVEIFREFLQNDQPVSKDADRGTQKPAKPKRPRPNPRTIDLHGLTLDEAKLRIDLEVNELAQKRGDYVLRIITGKGRHSGAAGGVLVREIYDFFMKKYDRYVVDVDEDPGKSLINGLPIRGYFDATCKF